MPRALPWPPEITPSCTPEHQTAEIAFPLRRVVGKLHQFASLSKINFLSRRGRPTPAPHQAAPPPALHQRSWARIIKVFSAQDLPHTCPTPGCPTACPTPGPRHLASWRPGRGARIMNQVLIIHRDFSRNTASENTQVLIIHRENSRALKRTSRKVPMNF